MKELLLVTWHGIHELDMYPGLPDTGGQNIYVQNLAEVIHDHFDCRVTILNRGGFEHPYTGRLREGYTKDPQRELYVLHGTDGVRTFLRKEFLTPALIEEAAENVIQILPQDYKPDLILSHFWDGGMMGAYLHRSYPDALHVWVPHEPVGIKKAPLAKSHYDRHSIELREFCEKRVMESARFVGSTSKLVRDDLVQFYNGAHEEKIIDIFPGVDAKRFSPAKSSRLEESKVRRYAQLLGLPESAFLVDHICEFGRSDSLKRKDMAVEAFARVCREIDDVVMFTNLDSEMEPEIAALVEEIIEREGIRDRIFVLEPSQLPQSGEGASILPDLMRTSRVFLTMSEMEGFGMAACEAAASAVPLVGTDQIPVLTDFIAPAGGGHVVRGGDYQAAADRILEILRLDEVAYEAMRGKAYRSVIPRFTWEAITQGMIDQIEARGYQLNGEAPPLVPPGEEGVI